MPEIAFTAESMAACAAARRHAWRWVPTWGHVGFRECSRCGATGPVGRVEQVGGSASNEGAKLDMEPAAEPDLEVAPPPPPPAPEPPPPAPPPPPPAKPAKPEFRGTRGERNGPRARTAARNAEIVRCAREGMSVERLAEVTGLGRSSIYAILKSASPGATST